MPPCPKHPKFHIQPGVYYRAADPNNQRNWLPKNPGKCARYYEIAASDDFERMAAVMGEAQMTHSNESSDDSPFISVASCPVCLSESTDPTVRQILAERRYVCRLAIDPRNTKGAPYIFQVGGEGIGAQETEALVLLPPGTSLLQYHNPMTTGYLTLGYIDSMK